MFINRYKFVYRNLDALRRMNIIKLKNSASYDKTYSAVTVTFFPISIILLPFIPAVIAFCPCAPIPIFKIGGQCHLHCSEQ